MLVHQARSSVPLRLKHVFYAVATVSNVYTRQPTAQCVGWTVMVFKCISALSQSVQQHVPNVIA